ncbi:hypothetical protein [Variovorax fucosicus]|uniref:hypothetical protein n=1 Tax=Variovorax fucosicus TaxID=3053517 RepID=UPI0025758BDA|nr:hypothetical protein [Variovorax sp. J22G47]MDM0059027.1 hypothetical protein [Variovorax sp. J22G47]
MTSLSRDEAWLQNYQSSIAARAGTELEKASGAIADFAKVAARRGVTLNAEAFAYLERIGIVARLPGLAKAMLQDIQSERDGLYPVDGLARNPIRNRLQEGCLAGPDCVFMAHPWFRRAMHPLNHWAPHFVERFWALELPGVKKYIALDADRVRLNVDDPLWAEADTWFGAPFNEDVRQIKAGTAKLRPPQDLETHHVDFFFAQAHCVDIKWTDGSGIKSFQALELKTQDVQLDVEGKKYHPARYLHAEFDLDANCFRHFDGAVQLFSPDEYLQRRDSDFNMTIKNAAHVKARSRKLFKLNGPVDTGTWVDLCCHFCSGNPLMIEYFAGVYPRHVTDVLEKIRAVKQSQRSHRGDRGLKYSRS